MQRGEFKSRPPATPQALAFLHAARLGHRFENSFAIRSLYLATNLRMKLKRKGDQGQENQRIGGSDLGAWIESPAPLGPPAGCSGRLSEAPVLKDPPILPTLVRVPTGSPGQGPQGGRWRGLLSKNHSQRTVPPTWPLSPSYPRHLLLVLGRK